MITTRIFDTWNDTDVLCYRITNARGHYSEVLDWGLTLYGVCVPDRRGVLTDVLLGYPDMEGYLHGGGHLGGTIGRVANRIGGASFTLCGKTYTLPANEGGKCLHGGEGLDRRMWRVEARDGNTLVGRYTSPDGEEGFPGRLDVAVAVTFSETDELILRYDAVSDAPTPVNMTNHAYFNLLGKGTVLEHTLWIASDEITPLDEEKLPTGVRMDVSGTPFDFRTPKRVGRDIGAQDAQLAIGGGYDVNYVLRGSGMRCAASLRAPNGVAMQVFTDAPCMQLYSANFLRERQGKDRLHGKHAGLCLETQGYPNALNTPGFPSIVLAPGERYAAMTVYAFETDD